MVAQHSRRTAEEAAAFLLPKLRPGMRLLDAGCGPGSITAGLVKYVAPGEVVGVDAEPGILETAREFGAGVPNLSFEEASVYALPYEDNSFDVAYAHQLMQHLADPTAALREMGRVVRPGGFVAARDSDYQTMISHPRSEAIEEWRALYTEVVRRNGADANAGRRIPSWFARAGLEQGRGVHHRGRDARPRRGAELGRLLGRAHRQLLPRRAGARLRPRHALGP